ncbi:hypothetical protein [Pseudomonas gessardii]|uniref:hypothetical protein n=1 Tax=Pseudomonas gessardii TaxID=78544 RepID=UPI0014756348|nr:hypothetical protein [Pseudomonas gessardii]NNA69459.1 hypothetical protein [Pseudomonas gessardii]
MQLTGIQIKSMQNSARTYDAIILQYNGMHFSKDLPEKGDLEIRWALKMAKDNDVTVDCYDQRLQERIKNSVAYEPSSS